MKIRTEKENIRKNYYYKRKKMMNNLINCVKELENISVNKLVFKNYKRFLNS